MEEYELIDSGGLEKLERFGQFVLGRPDPQAIWKKALPEAEWNKAQAIFNPKTKGWDKEKGVVDEWVAEIGGLKFNLSLSSFKHIGVFPEHVENWKWLKEQLKAKSLELRENKPKVLNLFGYTGGATMAVAKALAEVTHVDASKISVAKAKENAKLNSLEDAPIRWIVDDADKFVKKEISRGNKYDGIILDPPSFGRGVKGEVWKIEEGLLPLLLNCAKILNPNGFLLLNGYAEGFAPDSYAELLSSVFNLPIEKVESGKLFIKESSSRNFILPAGIYARIASL